MKAEDLYCLDHLCGEFKFKLNKLTVCVNKMFMILLNDCVTSTHTKLSSSGLDENMFFSDRTCKTKSTLSLNKTLFSHIFLICLFCDWLSSISISINLSLRDHVSLTCLAKAIMSSLKDSEEHTSLWVVMWEK